MKELSKNIYYIFGIIYVIVIYQYIYQIHHVNVVTKPPRILSITFLQDIFHKNRPIIHLYCLVNIRNISVNCSHCGPVHFKNIIIKISHLSISIF